MIVALFLFIGYVRVLYFIFFQSKDKIFIWRFALFLLSFLPLIGSLYFFDLRNIVLAVDKHKFYLKGYIVITLLTFIYANWRIIQIGKNEENNKEMKKDLMALMIAVIIYWLFYV